MSFLNFVRNSRLFLYLGFGLIFLGLVCLPAKVKVVVQPEVMETELWHMGPIFAILIGVWSFPSLLLGIIESSMSKKKILSWFTLILCLASIVLVSSVWDAIRFWRSILVRWLLSYSPLLTPCIIANIIGFIYFIKKAKLVKALTNLKIRVLSIILLLVIPLLLATMLMYMWLATIFY